MKLPFRAAILTILLGLIVATLTAVGISSYVQARLAAEDLSKQVLDLVSQIIDHFVDNLLGHADEQSALALKLMESGQLSRDDPKGLIAYWSQSLEVSPAITSQFIGYSKTGESSGVSRLQDGQLTIWESTRKAGTDKFGVKEYKVGDYPRTPFRSEAETPDIRSRPWFELASRSKRPIWTETYVFLGVGKLNEVLGVTHAAPLYGPDGVLESVVTADFDLGSLCRQLQLLELGRDGFAFIVELRADGPRVIAHPRQELLTGPRPPEGGSPSLVPIEKFDDARTRAMLASVSLDGAGATAGRQGASRFTLDGKRYFGNYNLLSGTDKPRWVICTVIAEEEILAFAHQASRTALLITLAALVLAIVVGVFVSGQVARPLEHLAREANRVGDLRLSPRPIAHSFVLEVDRLAVASEEMKSGLRSFRKYVPAELVRSLIDSGQDARLGGARKRLTIFFSDIKDFTTISETSTPEALVDQLGEYFGILSEEIHATGGTVDKYIGDSVMAFWGAPQPISDTAASACSAAVRIQKRLGEAISRWESEGRPPLITRIGIHTGEVVVGNIGNESRMNYTVVGDSVNLASRLEGLNKTYGTSILISEETYLEAAGSIQARPLGRATVKGRSTAVTIYELTDADRVERAAARPETMNT